MSLAEGIAARVAYKAYATGDITSNSEPAPGTDPGAASAKVLRRVGSSLNFTRDNYTSAEINASRQIKSMRLGKKGVSGEISGELSPGTYFDFIEAAHRGTKQTALVTDETDFTSLAADNATSKFTLGSSTWAALGYRVGDTIRPSNTSQNAGNNFTITALSGVDATVFPAPTTHTADTTATVTRPGCKVGIPLTGHVKRKFAFEHYFEDVDIARLFTECRVMGYSCSLPSTGMATINIPVMGRNMTTYTAGSAPFFTSPTAANSEEIAAAVTGTLILNGTQRGVLTGMDFSLDLGGENPAVIGQDIAPEIFLGAATLTGTLTAFFENATDSALFETETEFDICVVLKNGSTAGADFVSWYFGRVKATSYDVPLSGAGGVVATIGFQALEREAATGYDQTTVVCLDSVAT